MTVEQALANAVRLLQAAEMETDLAKMKAINELADSWLGMVSLLVPADPT